MSVLEPLRRVRVMHEHAKRALARLLVRRADAKRLGRAHLNLKGRQVLLGYPGALKSRA
jgi:hypothetical protein